jgi:hypothetical protein
MLNFIKKLYLFIAKIFIVMLGGLGVILGLYYLLSLLMGSNSAFPYLMGGIGGVIYMMGFLDKLLDGDFE